MITGNYKKMEILELKNTTNYKQNGLTLLNRVKGSFKKVDDSLEENSYTEAYNKTNKSRNNKKNGIVKRSDIHELEPPKGEERMTKAL